MLLLAACASDQPAPVEDLSDEAEPSSQPTQAPPQRTPDVGGVHHVVRGDTLYAIAFRNGLDYRDIASWNGIVPPYRIYAGQDLRLTPPGAVATASSVTAVSPPAKAAPASPPQSPAPVSAQPSKQAASAAMFEDVPPEVAEKPGVSPPPSTPSTVAATVATAPPSPPKAAEPPPARPPPIDAGGAAKMPPVEAGGSKIAEDSVTTTNGLTWRWPGKGTLAATFVAGDQTRQGIDIAGKAGDPVLAAGDGEVVYSGNGLLGYGELIIVKHNASFLSAYGHNRKRLVQEGDKVRAGQQIAEMGSSGASRDQLHFEIRKNGKPVNPLDYLPAR